MNQILKSNRRFLFAGLLVIYLCAPGSTKAEVSTFVFITSPQSVSPEAVSDVLTMQVQDAGGNASTISQTGCIAINSTSASGQFSSSATNWNPVSVLTMNSGSSKRNVYYKDAAAGAYTLTATFVLKPTSVSTSCTSWPQSEWGNALSATQAITIGSASQTSDAPPPSSTTTTFTQQVSSPTQSAGTRTLSAEIRTEPVVMVGAGTYFAGSAFDADGNAIAGARYLWNFGDGSTAEGRTVFHTYVYPGTYPAGLTVASGNEAGMARTTVEAEPVQLGLIVETDGSVVLSNQSSREMNIGLWSLTSGMTTFVFPQDTIVLSGETLHLSTAVMHMAVGQDASVSYPNGMPVAVTKAGQPAATPFAVPSLPASTVLQGRTSAMQKTSTAIPNSSAVAAASSSVPLAAAAESSASLPVWSWILGILGVVLLAFGAFAYSGSPLVQKLAWVKKSKETNPEVDEFEIE